MGKCVATVNSYSIYLSIYLSHGRLIRQQQASKVMWEPCIAFTSRRGDEAQQAVKGLHVLLKEMSLLLGSSMSGLLKEVEEDQEEERENEQQVR